MPGAQKGGPMTEGKHRAAVRLSAAAAVLAVGFWPAALPSSAKPEWIVNQSALSLLGGAGLTQAQLQTLFGNDRTYLIRGLTQTAEPVSGALRTVSFTSYQAMERQFAGPGLPAGTRAVLYDNEDWSFTPVDEQRNPAKYEELAASLVHAHHLLFIAAPAVDLTDVLAPGESDHYAAYLRLGLAASAAKYADVIDIQAQGSETSLNTFTSFVKAAAAQARNANRHVIVLAGLSTNPSGQHVTSGQLVAAYNSARTDVNGYWLNIPSGGPYCPRCGTPQPQVAVPLLRMLLPTSG
jgi:hypothetical protein